MNWQTVKDKDVRHLWSCPCEDCDEKCYIDPTFYESSGTPVCTDCDEDMIYIQTEINT